MSTARVMLAGSGLPTTQHIAMSMHNELYMNIHQIYSRWGSSITWHVS